MTFEGALSVILLLMLVAMIPLLAAVSVMAWLMLRDMWRDR